MKRNVHNVLELSQTLASMRIILEFKLRLTRIAMFMLSVSPQRGLLLNQDRVTMKKKPMYSFSINTQ